MEKLVYDRVGLATYVWPKNTDFFIRANFNSDNFEVVQITVAKCAGSNWKSASEIEAVMNTHNIDLALISSYFDFDDYDNPIHYYLQDMNVFTLVSTLGLKTQYQVRQNQATENDDIIFGSQGTSNEISFYTVKNIDFVLLYLH